MYVFCHAVSVRLLGYEYVLYVFLCNVFLICSHCYAVFFLWFVSLLVIMLFSGSHGRLMIVNICIMLDLKKLVHFS